jgi:DNA-binding NtrC family response regulator
MSGSCTMTYVLVVSQDGTYRRLLVDNLVRRSFVAVGVASLAESERLIQNTPPGLILIYGELADYKPELARIHSADRLAHIPVVLISADTLSAFQKEQDNVVAHFADSSDLRRLVERLRPWLPARD